MRRLVLSMAVIIYLSGWAFAQPFGLHKGGPKKNCSVLSSPQGRFVFGQISGSSKDQYMLDTWTGRLWRMTENSKIGKFLAPIPYQRENNTYSALPPQNPEKKK